MLGLLSLQPLGHIKLILRTHLMSQFSSTSVSQKSKCWKRRLYTALKCFIDILKKEYLWFLSSTCKWSWLLLLPSLGSGPPCVSHRRGWKNRKGVDSQPVSKRAHKASRYRRYQKHKKTNGKGRFELVRLSKLCPTALCQALRILRKTQPPPCANLLWHTMN